ncbi:hypothetical protein [Acrocarpospora corrugata]|uniref:hypothetical protein n=1 Tax=Acrocarpospora corrugata TaxID=35763 RepID=UPI0014796726|nr:hypothetical protein [Acrocarpospora corrugata]
MKFLSIAVIVAGLLAPATQAQAHSERRLELPRPTGKAPGRGRLDAPGGSVAAGSLGAR